MNLGSGLPGGHGRRPRVRRGAAMVVAVSVAMLGGIAVAATSASALAGQGKAWVCHATDSDTNPYRIINVSVNSTKYMGHLEHAKNPNKTWKSAGTFGGVTHAAGSKKPDIIGAPGAKSAPEECGAGEVETANASLTLVKKIENGGPAKATYWTLDAKGTSSFAAGTTPVTHEVADGTYTLSEAYNQGADKGDANYTPSLWNCSNADVNGATVTIGADDTDVTCIITNTYKQPETHMADLKLIKVVDNLDGLGKAQADEWMLGADGLTPFASGKTGVTHAVADGAYALSEKGPSGYDPSGWVCTREGSDTEGSHAAITNGSNNTVTIGPDDKAVTCTITNTFVPPPKPQMVNLALVKKVVNSNASPSLWMLHADSVPAATSFEGKTGTDSATHVVPVGTYNLSESGGPTTGFTNTGWTCPGATMSDSDTVVIGALNSVASDNVATVRTVTCTITNTFVPSPPPPPPPPPADAPAISLEKVATLDDTNGDGVANAGESILYTFKVTNIGNVVLTTIAVVDPLLDSALGSAVTCAPTTLLPGGTAACTAAAFPVTPANATGSDIVNVATASGLTPTGSQVEATDTVRTLTGGAVERVVTVAPDTVPATVVKGPATVVKGAVVTKTTVAPAKVTALAFTGAETVPLGLSGLLAVLLGAGLVATTRRQGRRANN